MVFMRGGVIVMFLDGFNDTKRTQAQYEEHTLRNCIVQKVYNTNNQLTHL